MESQNRPKYFQNYIFNILKTKQSFFRHIYFVFLISKQKTNTFCLKHFSLLTQGSRSTVRRGSSDRCASSRILFPFSLSVYERWAKKEGGHRLKTTALSPFPPAPSCTQHIHGPFLGPWKAFGPYDIFILNWECTQHCDAQDFFFWRVSQTHWVLLFRSIRDIPPGLSGACKLCCTKKVSLSSEHNIARTATYKL